MNRFSKSDVAAWREDGFAIVPDFFSAEELAPILADYERVYGTTGEGEGHAIDEKEAGDIGVLGEFRDKQFQNIDTLPYNGSTELNLLSLHPALISFSVNPDGVENVDGKNYMVWRNSFTVFVTNNYDRIKIYSNAKLGENGIFSR